MKGQRRPKAALLAVRPPRPIPPLRRRPTFTSPYAGLEEPANLLSVHKSTLYRLIRVGQLPPSRLGSHSSYRFHLGIVLDFLKRRERQRGWLADAAEQRP
jgi:excisionase family DNA binding protein